MEFIMNQEQNYDNLDNSVNINNSIRNNKNVVNVIKNYLILSSAKKSPSIMMMAVMKSKCRHHSSTSLFSSYYYLLWLAVFVFFDLRFWAIDQNFASVEASIVCPKLIPVRKTPRFGKRSADYNKMYPFECLEFKKRLINEFLPMAKIVHSSEISKTNYELIDSLTQTGRSLVASSSAPPIPEGKNIFGVIYGQPNQFEKYFLSILNKHAAESTPTSAPSVDANTTVSTKSLISTSLSPDSGIKDSNESSNTDAETTLRRQREILARLLVSYIDKLKEKNQRQQQKQQP